jgi:hypothetical protein
MNLKTLSDWAQPIYYTGAGAVLFGTAIRFFFRMFRKFDRRDEFIERMQDVHLINIYAALEQIAQAQGIKIEYPFPPQA